MSETKFLKCSCEKCGGHIEYPADAVGFAIECPHCRWRTELTVEVPEPEAPPQRHGWHMWALIVLLVLGLAGAAAPLLLRRALTKNHQKLAAPTPAPVTSPVPAAISRSKTITNDFEFGSVIIDRSGKSVVYAVGSLRNLLPKQRFGVRVEIELRDSAERPVGTASDYASVIEPKAEWRFKALILKASATTACIAGIKEQ